jgi:hypothetical protein
VNADSTIRVGCPYCGERIGIVIDPGADAQRYIEDCEVCCRPIVFEVWRDAAGDWGVAASREDDA